MTFACTQCNTFNAIGSLYCQSCGAPLPKPDPAPKPPKKRKGKSNHRPANPRLTRDNDPTAS